MSEPSWTDVVQAFSAIVMAAFTAVLTWLGIVQAKLLKRSTALSKTALVSAQDSARAAIRAAEMAESNLVAIGRARVHFDKASTLYFPNSPTSKHVIGLVNFIWRNTGSTAPVNMRQAVRMRYDFTPPKPDDEALFAEGAYGSAFVPPGGTADSASFQVSRGQYERVQKGEAFIHFYGVALYNDGMTGTPERRSTFCVQLEPGIPKAGGGEVAFQFTILGEYMSAT